MPPVFAFLDKGWLSDHVKDTLLKLKLPDLPVWPETGPMEIPAAALLGLGALILLVAIWRLVTLRFFRFFFAFLAGLLIAYYPVAYGVHWWVFKEDLQAKADPAPKPDPPPNPDAEPKDDPDAKKEMPEVKPDPPPAKAAAEDDPTRKWMKGHLTEIDYGIMAGGGLIGLLIFSFTLGGDKRRRRSEEEEDYNPMAGGVHKPQPRQQQARQQQRPQQRQPRNDNPFDFS